MKDYNKKKELHEQKNEVVEVTQVTENKAVQPRVGLHRIHTNPYSGVISGGHVVDVIQKRPNQSVEPELFQLEKEIGKDQNLVVPKGKLKAPPLKVQFPSGIGKQHSADELFRRILKMLKEVIWLPEKDLIVLTGHIYASYFYESYPVCSYVSVVGQPGTGKSVILKAVSYLSYNSLWCTGADPEATVRNAIDRIRGTTIFEEIQKDGSDASSLFHKILTIGNEAPGPMNVNTQDKTGAWNPTVYCVYGPKFFGGVDFFAHDAIRSRTYPIFTLPNIDVSDLQSVNSLDWQQAADELRNDMLLARQMRFLGEMFPPALYLRDEKKYRSIGARPFQVFEWIFNEVPTQEVLDIVFEAIQEKLKDDSNSRSLDRDADILLAMHRCISKGQRMFQEISEDPFLVSTDRITANNKAVGSIHRKFRMPFKLTKSGRSSQASLGQIEAILKTMGVTLDFESQSSPPTPEVEG